VTGVTEAAGSTAGPAARPVEAGDAGRSLVGALLVLFMISCIFDPADRVLSLKVPLFAACWAVTLAQCSFRRERCRLPLELIVYTLLFVAIPFASIVGYYVTGGGQPYDGFQLLKGYVLVSLGALLYLNRIDVLPQLCAVLTALAVLILGVAIAVAVEPTLYDLLYLPGSLSGLLFLDRRDYAGLVMLQVYFVTSPMLVISIAYYFHLAKTHASHRRRLVYGGLCALSIAAMFFAGTRNNILVSLLLPLALVLLYSRSRLNGVLISAGATAVLGGVFLEEIGRLFDPTEVSNFTKLSLLQDYADTLSRPLTLLAGSGLGAWQFWEAKGASYFISELTFLEMIRNFGLFGALLMGALLAYPVVHAFAMRRSRAERHLVIAWAFYLLMCVSNPNLFSSMGILILSVLIANLFRLDGAPRNVPGHASP
jgi:hypothetical protein